jgi:hypothetical protein
MIKTFFLRLCLGLALGSAFLLSSAQAARVALVIGNAAYLEGPLRNPVNDARAMDQKLTSLGFRVERIENLKRQQIGRSLSAFSNSIKAGDEVVVFYAGHGVQVKGINYLPAVDADIQTEDDIPLNSLNLNALMERLDESKAGLKLLFLDACRNNPYARSFRSGDRGLARVGAAPSGTLIHFATRPGMVAADGTGANGLYTTELLRHLDTPNTPVEIMLKRVSAAVETQSKGQQEPWTEGGIRGEFYFKLSREDEDLRTQAQTKREQLQRPSAPQNQSPLQVTSSSQSGTITIAGLEWMRCSVGQMWEGDTCKGQAGPYTLDQAKEMLSKFNATGYAGKHDWRLPTIRELQSLRVCSTGFSGKRDIEDGGEQVSILCKPASTLPTINQSEFPKTVAHIYWSSNPMAESNATWGVYFGGGDVNGFFGDKGGYLRLLRTNK